MSATRHPVKRAERAGSHRAIILEGHNAKSQTFLDFVLAQYVTEGETELGMDKLPNLLDLTYGSPSDAVRELGSVAEIRDTFRGFQRQLYDADKQPRSDTVPAIGLSPDIDETPRHLITVRVAERYVASMLHESAATRTEVKEIGRTGRNTTQQGPSARFAPLLKNTNQSQGNDW